MRAPIVATHVPRLMHCHRIKDRREDVLDDHSHSNRPLRAARAKQKECDVTTASFQSASKVSQQCTDTVRLPHDAGDDTRVIADVAISEIAIARIETAAIHDDVGFEPLVVPLDRLLDAVLTSNFFYFPKASTASQSLGIRLCRSARTTHSKVEAAGEVTGS